MKKLFFYFLSIIIAVFFILSLDFTLSNTVLSYKNCFKYDEFYYELKKNCIGKYRFKKSFPIVKTITDEMGLRVGENSCLKIKQKIYLYSEIHIWSRNRV